MAHNVSLVGDTHPCGRERALESRLLPGTSWLGRVSDPTIALACMFAVGGMQGVVIMAGSHWEIASPGIVLVVAAVGIMAGPGIWVLRRRFRAWSRQVGLGIGTVATSVAVFGCGAQPSSMSAASFYFLVVLYAAAYFRRVVAAAHVALVGVLYAVVLALHPAPAFPAQWLQAMSVLGLVALIVSGFASYVRSSAAAMSEQAFRDRLTGLANRALFLDRLDHALERGERALTPVAVLFLDLDDFKVVNDSFGHPVGDQLLISAAQRLASVTRASDTLARFGGDEFAVLIEGGAMPRTAEDLAERILGAFEVPFDVGAEVLHVGVSIGVAVRQPGGGSATYLLRDADLAMYEAKRNGKGRYECVRAGMQDEAVAYLTLIADLGRALQERQFEVFYQPIVATGTGQPVGVEALVRWQHPQRGLVTPDQFIGAAESTGLIVPLGAWVLREACVQAQAWRRTAGMTDETFYVSVNVSPRQLTDPGFLDVVRRALHESGLPSAALVLEITESTLMSDFSIGLARLHELKKLGLRLALDDYGTGYSSMSRLRRLPVDIVKIDKSFVDDVGDAGEGTAIVRSIIDVTEALRMVCIAEGVETPAQYRVLEQLGCGAIQGYLFARPTPAADTRRTLRRLAANTTSHPRVPPRGPRDDR